MKIRFLLPLLLLAATSLHAQSIRVMTYNMLEFGESEAPARATALRAVIDATTPDIICAQEIQGPQGYFTLHSTITGPAGYMSSGFIDGPDLNDDELFFNPSTIEWLTIREIEIEPRPAHIYSVRVIGTADTIDIVVVDLQEGTTQDDINMRADACQLIRATLDTMPRTHHRMVVGNLNMESSDELGYQTLTLAGIVAAGEVSDPLARPGHWSNDSSFADLHTGSTRTTALNDGGSGGGLHDRFDQILMSPSLAPAMVMGSYRAVGQDGKHFNAAVNDGVNTDVSSELAQALYTASDHLPVIVDLQFSPSGVEGQKAVKTLDLSEQR